MEEPLEFQATTIRRSSTGQGGAGSCDVITIDDDDDDGDPVATDTTTPGRGASRLTAMEHLDSQSGSRTDYLARGAGGSTARDHLTRAGGTLTLGGQAKVETVTALRSVPQRLTGPHATPLATPSSTTPTSSNVGIPRGSSERPLPLPMAASRQHPLFFFCFPSLELYSRTSWCSRHQSIKPDCIKPQAFDL